MFFSFGRYKPFRAAIAFRACPDAPCSGPGGPASQLREKCFIAHRFPPCEHHAASHGADNRGPRCAADETLTNGMRMPPTCQEQTDVASVPGISGESIRQNQTRPLFSFDVVAPRVSGCYGQSVSPRIGSVNHRCPWPKTACFLIKSLFGMCRENTFALSRSGWLRMGCPCSGS